MSPIHVQKFASLRHYNSKHSILCKKSEIINTSAYSDWDLQGCYSTFRGQLLVYSLEENYWCYDNIGKHCTHSIQAFPLAHEYSTSDTFGGDIFNSFSLVILNGNSAHLNGKTSIPHSERDLSHFHILIGIWNNTWFFCKNKLYSQVRHVNWKQSQRSCIYVSCVWCTLKVVLHSVLNGLNHEDSAIKW